MSILTSDKVDFKAKITTRDKECYNNNKKINPSGRHNDLKYVLTNKQRLKIHVTKTNGAEKCYRQIHNYSWGLQQSTFSKWLNNQTENQPEY